MLNNIASCNTLPNLKGIEQKTKKFLHFVHNAHIWQTKGHNSAKYTQNLPEFELERRLWVTSLPCKFHENPTIPSKDIVRKASGRTARRTDGRTEPICISPANFVWRGIKRMHTKKRGISLHS